MWNKDMLRRDDFTLMKEMMQILKKHRQNEYNAGTETGQGFK